MEADEGTGGSQADATAIVSSNTPGYITLSPVYLHPEGPADVFLKATPGRSYIIQATTNFIHWLNIETNTATSDLLIFTDANAGQYQYRFYRAIPYDPGFRLTIPGRLGDGSMSFDLLGTQG